jgi:serine/threonine protein phosphatase PrpC
VDVVAYDSASRTAARAHDRQQAQALRWSRARRSLTVLSCFAASVLVAASYYRPRLRAEAVLVVLLVVGGVVFAWWPTVKGLLSGRNSAHGNGRDTATAPHLKAVPDGGQSNGVARTPALAVNPPSHSADMTVRSPASGPRHDVYQQPHQSPQKRPQPAQNPVRYLRTEPPLRPLVFVRPSAFGAADWRLPTLLAQPGAAADEAQVGDLAVRAASVIGRGHRHAGEKAKPRQDAYQLREVRRGDRGYLVAAVADGTSSAKHADLGASIAAVGSVRFLEERLSAGSGLDEQAHAEMFEWIATIIHDIAARDQNRADAYTTTLLTVVVPDMPTSPDGSREVLLSWIGDSPAWVFNGDGWRQEAGHTKHGLDQNTLDACLPGTPQRFRFTSLRLAAGTALALMTDGLGDVLTNVSTSQTEFARRWAKPPSLPEFLRDLDFDAPGQDDDRTAVILWCPPGRQAAS